MQTGSSTRIGSPGADAGCPGWIGPALGAAAIYLSVGILFALPASHVRAWRFGAWAVSAVVYATQVCYEHFRLRNSVHRSAAHVAFAAALGALGLAAAAVVYRLMNAQATQPAQALGFAVWPIITGIPAYLVAAALAAVLWKVAPDSICRP